MNKIIFLAVMITSMLACTSTNEKKQNENIDLVKSYVQAVENLDFDSMSSFLDDNYLGIGPSYGDSIGKSDAVENWKWSVANLYQKIKYERSRFAAVTISDGDNKGDWVANWAELKIDYKDGGSAIILANTNYLIENGKIVRSLTFYNEADVLRQLGYIIILDENTEVE